MHVTIRRPVSRSVPSLGRTGTRAGAQKKKVISSPALSLPFTAVALPAGLTTQELDAIRSSLEQQIWATDPVDFIEVRCQEFMWSKQKEVAQALVDYRKVAVPSCHGSGKSWLASRLAAWWLCGHALGEAFVVSTAPTGRQVRAILWREIGRVHAKAGLPGRTNQTEWLMEMPAGNEELVAFGMKPDDLSPSSFQGIHGRFVLVLMDEATGIASMLWDSADTLTANNDSRQLAIGNPDDPVCEFAKVCKPGSGWHVIPISAFDTPNFTQEDVPVSLRESLVGPLWVEEKRKKWGETHPFWFSKVLGQFPVGAMDGSLIPLQWIRTAQERTLVSSIPHELGLDVGASVDGDPSCLGERHGPVFRVLWEQREPDTMKTTGRTLQALHETRAERVKVDYIGVGRGVVDRSREQGESVYPISVGESCTRTSCKKCYYEWDDETREATHCPKCGHDLLMKVFANLLSQLWWDIRGLFEREEIDLDEMDEDLAAELVTLSWAPNSKGQIQVSYGNGPSPNRADSLLMTFAPIRSQVSGKFYPQF